MGAAVAGVVEESAFRGYMQVPIENRHGLAVATAVVAMMFSLAHLNQGVASAVPLVPFLFGGISVYSILAYLTGSIMPGMILHTSTDVILGILALGGATSLATSLIPGKETGLALFVDGTLSSMRALKMLLGDPRPIQNPWLVPN